MNSLAAKRETQIPYQLGQLEKIVSSLGLNMEALMNRLASVTRIDDTVSDSDARDIEKLVDHAQTIDSIRSRVAACNGLLISILDRLEV